MDINIVTSLISGGVTAFVAIIGLIGTLTVQKKKTIEAHIEAQREFTAQIDKKLDEHREEYLSRINDVEKQVRSNNEIQSQNLSETKHWQEMMELKFENLSEKVTKHNNVVERITKAELNIAVLQNREKVSEHRLQDLEDDQD